MEQVALMLTKSGPVVGFIGFVVPYSFGVLSRRLEGRVFRRGGLGKVT